MEYESQIAVGITGHQRRDGIDWSVIRGLLTRDLQMLQPSEGFSCLAIGSDQLFADICQRQKISVTAVIPFAGYEKCFKPPDLVVYERLLHKSINKVQLEMKGSEEQAFFDAGKFVVDRSSVLYAIWDGEKSGGLGGTADVVCYVQSKKRKVRWIDSKRYVISDL